MPGKQSGRVRAQWGNDRTNHKTIRVTVLSPTPGTDRTQPGFVCFGYPYIYSTPPTKTVTLIYLVCLDSKDPQFSQYLLTFLLL